MSTKTHLDEAIELISWHQKACIELAKDMTNSNHQQVLAARQALLAHFQLGLKQAATKEATT